MSEMLLRDKLTIILTLKGRCEYTFRWIEYVNRQFFPFTILIADGGADNNVSNWIAEKNLVGINIKYVKFDEDATYEDFYKKVRKALEFVHTPYYIMADNDDFYSLNGLVEAIAYLENNPEYVACGGRLVPFNIVNSFVYGDDVKFYNSNYDYYLESDPSERLVKYFNGAPGIYYSVIKTEVGKAIWQKIVDYNFRDIRMPELLIDCLVIASGKVYNVNSPFYFRQVGVGVGNEVGLTHNFFDEIFTPTWSNEINHIADLVIDSSGGKISRDEFWFYLERFLLPRVLNGIRVDSYGPNDFKIRKILLKKFLNSIKIFSFIKSFFSSKIVYGFCKNNQAIKCVLDFLASK
jgi:glycosyltransferase domain-containing protein